MKEMLIPPQKQPTQEEQNIQEEVGDTQSGSVRETRDQQIYSPPLSLNLS